MTSKQARSAAVWTLTIALSGCAGLSSFDGAEPDGPPLSGDQIRAKLEGNTIAVQSYRTYHGPISVYFLAYGQMRGLRSNNYRDAGSWRVTDDGVCLTWRNWWSNVEQCWTIYAHGRGIIWISKDGRFGDVSKVTPGNVKNI